MIDPNIILQSKTPTEQAQGAANVAETNQRTANLATLGQLQRGQLAMQPGDLQAQALENQQRQQAITDDQNFRALYQKTVVNGQPLTDSQVLSTLGPTHGAAFLTAQLASRKTRADIQKLNDEGQTADADYAGGLATMVAKAGNSPDAVNRAIATAHHDGHEDVAQQLFQLQQTNPQAIPGIVQGIISRSPKWSTEARLDQAQKEQAARDAQIANHNQVTESQAADIAQRNTDRDVETHRHNTVMEGLGQQRANQGDARVDQGQQRIDNSAAGGGGPTANGQGVQGRFDVKEIDAARTQLDAIHQKKTALGNALAIQNGEQYVDPKTGKLATDSMSDDIRNGLQQQYNNVKTAGQRIMDRYGDEKSGYRIRSNEFGATPAPAAAPQPAAAPRSALPQGGGKPLDRATAAQFLTAAGGDKVKARQLAQQSNWKF